MGADWNLRNNQKQEYKYFETHCFDTRQNQIFTKPYRRIMRTYYIINNLDDLDDCEKVIHRVSRWSKYNKFYR